MVGTSREMVVRGDKENQLRRRWEVIKTGGVILESQMIEDKEGDKWREKVVVENESARQWGDCEKRGQREHESERKGRHWKQENEEYYVKYWEKEPKGWWAQDKDGHREKLEGKSTKKHKLGGVNNRRDRTDYETRKQTKWECSMTVTDGLLGCATARIKIKLITKCNNVRERAGSWEGRQSRWKSAQH